MKEVNLVTLFNPQEVNIYSLLGNYRYKELKSQEVSREYCERNANCPNLAFNLYLPEIVLIIDNLKSAGVFPYNSLVENKVAELLGFKGEGIGRIVYGSQEYVHSRNKIVSAVAQAKALIVEGFAPLENAHSKIGKKFYFLAPGTTFLGESSVTKKKAPFTLVKDSKETLFMIKRANSRKGHIVNESTYVKAA